jgi:hypothetical protein
LFEFGLTVYFNLFNNDNIFKSINREKDDVPYEYAPFQFLAKYFLELGFDGILYNSTVYKEGVNIVVFNPKLLKIDEDSFARIECEGNNGSLILKG